MIAIELFFRKYLFYNFVSWYILYIFVHARYVFVATKNLATAELSDDVRFTHIRLNSQWNNRMKENRNEIIRARFSKEEKEIAIKRAKEQGVSLSAYIRKSVLGEKLPSKTDIQVVFELKKIGVNINQLTKHINTLPVDENIIDAIGRMDLYAKELKDIINKIV